MHASVRVPHRIWNALRARLLAVTEERFAYLLGRGSIIVDPWGGERADIYIRQAVIVPDESLTIQSPVRVEVDGAFTRDILRGCYAQGLSLVDVHTHPFAGHRVSFSGHDRRNMEETHREFHDAIPGWPPALAASLVLGADSVAGTFSAPTDPEVRPLDRLLLVGRWQEEVCLCA